MILFLDALWRLIKAKFSRGCQVPEGEEGGYVVPEVWRSEREWIGREGHEREK